MIILVSLLSFFGCRAQSSANNQTPEKEDDALAAYQANPHALYPVKSKGKWGFMNRNLEVVIVPQYDDATDFTGGIATVSKYQGENVKYGYIDSTGTLIIEMLYDQAGHFSEGKACVKKDNAYGYIDKNGRVVIPFQFEEASHFSNGFAAVKKDGFVGFINAAGEVVIKPQFTVNVSHAYFNEGLAPVFGIDEKTGFIDTTGNWAIENKFYAASNFKEGKAWALLQKVDPDAEHGFTIKGGYLNPDGSWAVEPQYDFGWEFTEGYAVVWSRSEDKMQKIWKLIDHQGNVVLDNLPYRTVGSLHYGVIPIQDEDMNWGFMNTKGEVVIHPKYSGINHFKNGLARMEAGSAFDNKIVYINKEGVEVWKE